MMPKRFRSYGLCVKELRKMKRHIKRIEMLQEVYNEIAVDVNQHGSDDFDDDLLFNILNAIIREEHHLYDLTHIVIPASGPRIHHIARTINSFSPGQCWDRFRIRKEDLYR